MDNLKLKSKQELLRNIQGDCYSKDPDHTYEAREFYSIYWEHNLSGEFDEYDGKYNSCNPQYRGETIISFNTMAAGLIRTSKYFEPNTMPKTSQKRLGMLLSFEDISDNLKDKFKNFYERYHTLANFMPFIYDEWIDDYWVAEHERKAQKEDYSNLNQVKGVQFHDFPDLFFKVIKEEGYDKFFSLNEKYPFLNSKLNLEYFTNMDKFLNNWKTYVEANYLQDLFEDDEYTTFIKLAPSHKKFPYRSKMLNEKEIQEIRQEIEEFLDNALKFIEKRAERLEKGRWKLKIKDIIRNNYIDDKYFKVFDKNYFYDIGTGRDKSGKRKSGEFCNIGLRIFDYEIIYSSFNDKELKYYKMSQSSGSQNLEIVKLDSDYFDKNVDYPIILEVDEVEKLDDGFRIRQFGEDFFIKLIS